MVGNGVGGKSLIGRLSFATITKDADGFVGEIGDMHDDS